MSKRPLHALTLLSGAICLGSLLMVGRSFFRTDVVFIPLGERTLNVRTIDGYLSLQHTPQHLNFAHYSGSSSGVRPYLEPLWESITGVRKLGIGWGLSGWYDVLILPLWLVPILTGILPVRWWRARRRGGARGFEVEPAATA